MTINELNITLSDLTIENLIEYFDGYGIVVTDDELIKKRIKQLHNYTPCLGYDVIADENGHLYEVNCECWYCKPITKGVIVEKRN